MALAAAVCLTAIAASAAPAAKPAAKPAPKLSKYQQAQLEKFNNSAPADRYFGKMKLSYLGMNNTFRDAAISSGSHTTDPAIVNKIVFAEDALAGWGREFPRDPQLARTYFLAAQVDRKIWIKANQERAWGYLNRIVQLFPDTYFGKVVKKDLTLGFTEHYYADPVPCAVPRPDSTADTVPAMTPAEGAATPSPAPTPIQKAKGLKVQIETPPCIQPATPSPTPTPAATDLSPPSTPAASPAVPAAVPSATATPSVPPVTPTPPGTPAPH